MNLKNPEGQVARWLEVLLSYQTVIEYRPGRLRGIADRLSRIPCRQCGLNDVERNVQNFKGTQHFNTIESTNAISFSMKDLQAEDRDIAKVIGWVQRKKNHLFQLSIAVEEFCVKSL